MLRHFFSIIAVLAAVLPGVSLADAMPPAGVTGEGVRIAEKGGDVVLSVDLTRPVGWRVWAEDAPPRVVLELADFELTGEPKLASTSIASLDIVHTAPDKTEMHALLREPLGIFNAEMTAHADGSARLEVRLKPTTAEVFASEMAEARKVAEAAPPRWVVAIDPGHGGIDPGAEAGDLREADLVLAFAGRLRDTLLASGRFDVVLTRSDDTLVSLDERLSRARAAGAGILISLHADALVDGEGASGVVFYRLDDAVGAAANNRLVERHAPDDRLTGVDLDGAGDDVSLALLDLARRDVIPRTAALSAALLGAFEGGAVPVNSRPERKGDFAILKAADIPSILVELGFLSTEADLARLTSEDWQSAAAMAIRDGLMLWADEDRLN